MSGDCYMNYDISYIDSLTRSKAAQRAMVFRWFAGQGEAVKIEATKLQGDLAQQNRSHYDPQYRTEFYFSMLVLALVKMHWIETAQSQKIQLTAEDARQLSDIRISRIKSQRKPRTSPKKDLIRVRFYEEIKTLKNDGLSWRQISEYIRLHHKKTFTFGYIRDCFNELTCERDGVGE